MRALIETHAADLLILDIQRLGGLTGWLQAAALCEAHNVPISNHLFHPVTGHALCACPGEILAEYLPWPSPFEEQSRVVSGELRMGSALGLGLSLAEEVVQRYRVNE